MTGFEVAALVAATVWLAALTVAILATIRQVGLLTLRVGQGAPAADDPLGDGLEVGEAVPTAVRTVLPAVDEGPIYALLLEWECAPCRELVADLRRRSPDVPLHALIRGPEHEVDVLVDLLPPTVEAVRDPDASVVAEELGVGLTPFVFEFERGVVTGKVIPKNVAELVSLIDAREHSNAAEVARRLGVPIRGWDHANAV